MSYKKKDLLKALKKIIGSKNFEEYINSAGVPRACTAAAEICFLQRRDEDEASMLVRQALTDLNGNAMFDFE